jgi:hypothetical protein
MASRPCARTVGRWCLATRAGHGARGVRCDGRAADQRERLYEVRRLAALGVAAAGRRGPGAREESVGPRARAGLELPAVPPGARRRRIVQSGRDVRDGVVGRPGLRPRHDAEPRGGYPGYGSHILLLPDGVGIFAFANRTYSGPRLRYGAPRSPSGRGLLRRGRRRSAMPWRARTRPSPGSTRRGKSPPRATCWR